MLPTFRLFFVMTKLKFVETSFNAVTQENIYIQTKSHWKTSQRDFDDKKR